MVNRVRRVLVVALAVACTLGVSRAEAQQGPPPPAGTVNVNVVSGTVGVTGTVAATQAGEWVTRSAEQAYTESARPTCSFVNQCVASFTAVPAGKVLRVTSLQGWVQTTSTTTNGIFSLHRDTSAGDSALFILPAPPFGAAYYGTAISFNEKVDVVFTAGQVPVLEVGTTGTLNDTQFNRLGLTGTLVPAPPTP